MTVNLSSLGGAGQQFFTDDGVPLAGGKLYSYAAGTTTPKVTYTRATGSIPHTNPIILNAAGRVSTGEIWLTDGDTYKFVLETSSGQLIATWDDVPGINDGINNINAANVQYDPSGIGAVSRSAQSKMRDTVSVKDFGAVGDGVTDDTTAVNAALTNATTTGAAVYFPAGTYQITSDINWPERTLIYGDGTQKTILSFQSCQLVLQDGQYWQGRDFAVQRTGTAGYALRMEGISAGSRRSYFSNVSVRSSTGGGVVMKGGWLFTWVNVDIQSCAGIGLLVEEGGFVTGWNSLNLIGGEIQGVTYGIVLDRVKQFAMFGTAVEGCSVAGIGIGRSVEAVNILGYFEANATGHIVAYDNSGGTIGQVSSFVISGGAYFLRGTGGADTAISLPAVRQFIIEDGAAFRGYATSTTPLITLADVGDSERGRGYVGEIRTDAPPALTVSNSCWFFGRERLLTYASNTTMPGVSDTTVNFPVNPRGTVLNSAKRAFVSITVNLTGAAGNGVFVMRGRNSAGTVVAAQVATTTPLVSGINSFTIQSSADWSDSVSYIDVARSGTSGSDTAGDCVLVGAQVTTYVNTTNNV